MDLRQLNALLAVADHGSFSAAARALHTVQSNVSTHVAHLERELGAVLVDRGAGALTEEGEAVAARARRIQLELAALESDVSALTEALTGEVRAGVIGTTGRWLVPRVLLAMERSHPGVRVVWVDATTTSLLPQVVNGSLDLAVVNLPIAADDISSHALFDEARIVIAPAGHPLYELEEIHLAELAEHELLLEPPGTAFRDLLDADADAAGVTLRTRAEVDGMRLVTTLAIEGYGAAVLPATAVAPYWSGDWRRVPVVGLSPRSVGLVERRRVSRSAAARVLIETIRAVALDDPPDGVRAPEN